ncbi:MAG TPA: DNA-3-methyladenine glycosylase I [Candidatus Dormibacteraeota bacterium]|nr:DNA-3-methyladenine glycosylase I [Candidatus Dormibacteraeota bacterium]
MAVTRCPWAESDRLMREYHDREWGVPVHDDHRLFEFLVLEGAQAGLSWLTILRRREAYRRAFNGFDPARVARFEESAVSRLLSNAELIRNRRKIESATANARVLLTVRRETGSIDSYLWSFVGGRPRQNAWRTMGTVPAETEQSRAMSKDLIKRGASFVGPTICYAFMQAVGMVNDHLVSCFRYRQVKTRA